MANNNTHDQMIMDLKRPFHSRKVGRFTTTSNEVVIINNYLPEGVVELVFHYLTSNKDRNAVSLVCKSWYNAERFSRDKVVVKNCHAINPERVIARFPRLASLTIKGKPLSPALIQNWGGSLHPWIETMVSNGVNLEALRVKNMVVRDETLLLLSRSLPNFRSLVLINCLIISANGLQAIASNCRSLREFDVQSVVNDYKGQLVRCFPNSCTTLVSLNLAHLHREVSSEALERLVARCPNLRSLRLNRTVPLDVLLRILVQAPQLVDLGVGSFSGDPVPVSETYTNRLKNALQNCTSIRSLSGFVHRVDPSLLPAIYPICQSLTSLNLRSLLIQGSALRGLMRHCLKLECLSVRGAAIGDEGLSVVASTCKELQELTIFGAYAVDVTENGLVVVSAGCPKLKSLTYTCKEMTNATLITVAKNCPNLVSFMLHTDATRQPLDEGFGAIVRSCKGLKRLKLGGLLTDEVFICIGMYAELLEKLTIPFAGDNEYGILYALNGCKKLKELDISNSSFGNVALLANVKKYETMRSLCVTSCQVTIEACKELAQQMPMLNVEIIGERKRIMAIRGSNNVENNVEFVSPGDKIKKMHVYRTLVGPRKDTSNYVWTL